MEIVSIIFISAVIFMVIENFDTTNSNYPYHFRLTFYYIIVTLTTVGYGDYYPITPAGRLFVVFIIVYVIVYLIPTHTTELLRLMGLKSFYAREFYLSNNEIEHIVITGEVVIQALKNFSEELFHPDHGI